MKFLCTPAAREHLAAKGIQLQPARPFWELADFGHQAAVWNDPALTFVKTNDRFGYCLRLKSEPPLPGELT